MSRFLVFSLAFTLTLALVTEQAHAQRRNKLVHIDGDHPGKRRASRARSPARVLSADQVLAVQRKVAPYEHQRIDLMEELIAQTPASQAMQKADLLFRLAEMYAHKARYHRYMAMELASRVDAAAGKTRKSIQRRRRRQAGVARKALRSAARAYAQVWRDGQYAGYARMDEVLFYGARSHAELGESRESRAAYQQLIKNHPTSPHLPEAYLAFADFYFDNGGLANAERFYQRILRLPRSAVHDYARYKLAWVSYNLGNFQDALSGFRAVALATRTQRPKQTLYRAARKDFVRTYAEIGRPEQAHKTFRKLDGARVFAMLESLADLYLEQGKNQGGVYILRALLAMKPQHARACDWQTDIARAMLSEGRSVQARALEVHNLMATYASHRQHGTLSGDALESCALSAGELAGGMARVWHREGLKTKDRETLQQAARLYQRYLQVFSAAEDRGETEYYHAELLWHLAESHRPGAARAVRWEQTAHAFAAAVTGGRLPEDKLGEAAYATVLAWQYALAEAPTGNTAGTANAAPTTTVSAPRAIPEREQKMLAAFDLYLQHVTDRKNRDLPTIKLLKARTYARHHHYQRAIPLFADIVDHHLDHASAADAVHGLLDALIVSKQEDRLLARVRTLEQNAKFLSKRPQLGQRLATIARTGQRKQAERMEREARHAGDASLLVQCGSAYIALYNRDPEARGAAELLYNAAVCFEAGTSLGTAIHIYRRLREHYPRSPLAAKAMARLGAAYARAGDYRRAARTLEGYGRRFDDQPDAQAALSDAVFYYRGTGDDERAIRASNLFIEKHGRKSPEQAAEAMYNTAAIYQRRGEDERVVAHLRRYLRRYGEVGGAHRRIAAHVRIGAILWSQSCPVTGVDGACIRVDRARNAGRRATDVGIGVRERCGDTARIRVRVRDRDRRLARAARRELNKALALYAQAEKATGAPAAISERQASITRRAAARARFLLADDAYEQFLAIQFPRKLNFSPHNPRAMARSQRRFTRWFEGKVAQGARTRELYRQAQIGDAHYAVASAARMGQIMQNFGDALFSAKVPRHLRTGRYAQDQVDAYCDALANKAEPLERASIGAFDACLSTSTRLGMFSDWSRLCERELGQLRPEKYPTASEVRPGPTYVAPVMSIERPMLRAAAIGGGRARTSAP